MKIVAYKGFVKVDQDSIVNTELKQNLNDLNRILNDDAMYNSVCLFIFLLCDLSNDNPLVDRPYNTKRDDALQIAFGETLEEFTKLKDADPNIRDLINKSIDIYIKEVNTDEQKDIATYNKKMDQFRIMLHGMTPKIEKNTHELNGTVSYSTNIEIINSVLGDIVSLIQAKASMIALHTNGTLPKHLRGGLSPLSRGKMDTDYEIVESGEADLTDEQED